MRRRAVFCVAVLVAASATSTRSASANEPAVAGTFTFYNSSTIATPTAIVTGPDGNLWFTNFGDYCATSCGSIGRITPAGTVTRFANASVQSPMGIAVGADGALWFTNSGGDSIGRISVTGHITAYSNASIDDPVGIAAGPDGALWFTNYGDGGPLTIGRITTAGKITHYNGPSNAGGPWGITAGPDGALWFTNNGFAGDTDYGASIGRITTAGKITVYGTQPSVWLPTGISKGADGALWFINYGSDTIGRITTAGHITNYTDPVVDNGLSTQGITLGPDGALWIANDGVNSIVRMTTDGEFKTYNNPGLHGPAGITTGPDKAVWFTNSDGTTIGRITTSVTTTGGVPGAPNLTGIRSGNGWVSVAWDAPSSSGSSPISSYLVTTNPGGDTVTVPAGARRAVVSVPNGTAQTAHVQALNSSGPGATSNASAVFTPTAATIKVTTAYDASDNSRLLKTAAYFGQTVVDAQRSSVGIVAYLVGIVHAPTMTPVAPPTSTGPDSYTTPWSTSEQRALVSVMRQYGLSPSESQYFSVQLTGYLLALGGH